MAERDHEFGPYVFHGRRKTLLKNGSVVPVGQRGLALLEKLLAADGRAVSKDDLLNAAWQTVNIEESNLTVQIAALRKALGRKPDGEEWIATVQRLGYQFVAAAGPWNGSEGAGRRAGMAAKPSLAVLPFANFSNDPEQNHFADGLAEDLITDLSKVSGLLVIARHSSFAYRNSAADTKSIASALGVSFIVEGSVRRSAQLVRINVQLIDAERGMQIWADRFDGELQDVFKLQDEVVKKIVAALSVKFSLPAPVASRRAPSLEAYDLFVRGRLFSMESPEANRMARPLLERACAIDPGFAEAHAWLALNLNFGWMYCFDLDARTRVRQLVEQAISIDPANADAHMVLGYVLAYNGTAELDTAQQQFQLALEINPNHADAHLFLGDLLVLMGRPDDAVASARRAFQLNPHPPPHYHWLLSFILYAARRYDEIMDVQRRDHPQAIGFQRNLAAALAQLGRIEDAKIVAKDFLALVPQFSMANWLNTLPFREAVDAEHFAEGYRKAGFPA